MSELVTVAVVGGIFSVLVAIVSFVGNLMGARKANAVNSALIDYRMKELENKVERLEGKMDKHNKFIERLTAVETTLGISGVKKDA